MRAYVIGVVRSAKRLDTLTFETREPGDRAFPWRVEHACELRLLAQSSRAELWSAWHALESVNSWGETTLGHVLTILRETVPCPDTPMVCFAVYGTANAELLEPLYRQFDQAFASKLGVPIFGGSPDPDATYEIASILSHDWWDDSAWREVVQ